MILLVKLLLAHLLGDFLLQPTSWVEAKNSEILKPVRYICMRWCMAL